MPTLISLPVEGNKKSFLNRSLNSTASMTDVKALLEGIHFNDDSLEKIEKEPQYYTHQNFKFDENMEYTSLSFKKRNSATEKFNSAIDDSNIEFKEYNRGILVDETFVSKGRKDSIGVETSSIIQCRKNDAGNNIFFRENQDESAKQIETKCDPNKTRINEKNCSSEKSDTSTREEVPSLNIRSRNNDTEPQRLEQNTMFKLRKKYGKRSSTVKDMRLEDELSNENNTNQKSKQIDGEWDLDITTIDEENSLSQVREKAPFFQMSNDDMKLQTSEQNTILKLRCPAIKETRLDDALFKHNQEKKNEKLERDKLSSVLNNANFESHLNMANICKRKPCIFFNQIPNIKTCHKEKYVQSFEKKVSKTIADFKGKRKGVLLDFKHLSKDEKIIQIERVNKILTSLNKTILRIDGQYCYDFQEHQSSQISSDLNPKRSNFHNASENLTFDDENHYNDSANGSSNTNPCKKSRNEEQDFHHNQVRHSLSENSFSDDDNGISFQALNQSDTLDKSGALLTPSYKSSLSSSAISANTSNINFCKFENNNMRRKRQTFHSVMKDKVFKDKNVSLNSAASFDSSIDEPSPESIEYARRDKLSYQEELLATPDSIFRASLKRHAVRSGKRGTDTSRLKLSKGVFSIEKGDCAFSDDDEFLPRNSGSFGRQILFSASQSPIQHIETAAMCASFDISENGEGFLKPSKMSTRMTNNEETPQNSMVESIQTIEGLDKRRVRWNAPNIDSFLHEAPANISMKESASFYISPLEVKKVMNKKGTKDDKYQLPSFPDPLLKYSDPRGRKLEYIYKWMIKREKGSYASVSNTVNSGIIFSLPLSQARDIILKLALTTEKHKKKGSSVGENVRSGHTLVICRSKVDLEMVSSAFREGSSFSVLNHATQPLAERTRQKFAAKCATFDVVLSTFDAMISKDVAIAVDENNHVVPQENDSSAWFSSRSNTNNDSNSMRIEKLSTLHLIYWKRVIFADNLGRKSYLAKFGTLRVKAAVALNASSRFSIFCPSESKEANQWEALCKSDRRSILSLSAVLRLPEGGDNSMFCHSVDLKTVLKSSY